MIERFKQELNQRKGQKQALLKELTTKQDNILIFNEKLLDLEEATLIIQKVAKDTQQSLFVTLNELVTGALDIVFENEGYSFELQAETKANGLQVYPILKQNGYDYSLKADSGYGIVQVIAFALRIALLSVKKNSTKIILLDEPNKDISAEYKQKASELMASVANSMGIQVITVTHEDAIKDIAEHTFKVTQPNKVSLVEEIISE